MSDNHELSSNPGIPFIEQTREIIDGQVFTRTVLPPATRTRRGNLSQSGAVELSRRADPPNLQELSWLHAHSEEGIDVVRSIYRARETDHVYPGVRIPRQTTFDTNQDHIDHISDN